MSTETLRVDHNCRGVFFPVCQVWFNELELLARGGWVRRLSEVSWGLEILKTRRVYGVPIWQGGTNESFEIREEKVKKRMSR